MRTSRVRSSAPSTIDHYYKIPCNSGASKWVYFWNMHVRLWYKNLDSNRIHVMYQLLFPVLIHTIHCVKLRKMPARRDVKSHHSEWITLLVILAFMVENEE